MKNFDRYIKYVITGFLLVVVLRLYELTMVLIGMKFKAPVFINELSGFLYDFLLTGALLAAYYPVWLLLSKISKRVAGIVTTAILISLSILHLFVIQYFLYQFTPLDIFLFRASFDEIFLSIKTSGDSYYQFGIGLIMVAIAFFVAFRFVFRKNFSSAFRKSMAAILIFSLPIMLTLKITDWQPNKFTRNKPVYLYARTLGLILQSRDFDETYAESDAEAFRKLSENKSNINPEYPLLHKMGSDVLGPFFDKKSEMPPNIVVLIVEGLNDDFVHPYRGVNLMPFLSDLKNRSLYWEKCFTLGERSFAAVPCLLGGLPYGETGFTLLEKLPRHLSLISVLHTNGYYTSFFYGQGAWFHQKNRFFQYNNIDLLFDKSCFSGDYDKIIVGDDHFFWGYDDMDLYGQSLEVLDTLPEHKRLDIYFTGSTHSPFIIKNRAYYESRMQSLVEKTGRADDAEFLNHYKKYLQTVLFSDDAIRNFLENYSRRPDFENTIFIITGDHPMTEVPISNLLKRYHVPLIIYSPLLERSKTFPNTVSHLDLYETILAFLSENYELKTPEMSASLGEILDTANVERERYFAFMNDNREIVDFYSDGYFLANARTLFKVKDALQLTEIADASIHQKMENRLKVFQKTNRYVSLCNKIIPDTLFTAAAGFNNLFSMRTDSLTSVSGEFNPIVEKLPVENKMFYFECSFDYKSGGGENMALVTQLSDSSGEVVYWLSHDLSKDRKFFQVNQAIEPQETTDSLLFFDAFFWNRSKLPFEYGKMDVSILAPNGD